MVILLEQISELELDLIVQEIIEAKDLDIKLGPACHRFSAVRYFFAHSITHSGFLLRITPLFERGGMLKNLCGSSGCSVRLYIHRK